MQITRPFSKNALLLIATGSLLVGCSAMPKMRNLFSGRGPDSGPELAASNLPPTTPAPEVSEGFTYQSKSLDPSRGSEGSGGWSLPEAPASTEPQAPGPQGPPNGPVPDTNYVRSSPSAPFFGSDQGGSYSTAAVQPGGNLPANGVYRGGKAAPVFAVTTLDGTRFDLSLHRGRVVLLDFWRKTCAPCLRAMPKVEELRKSYPENQLVVLGVNTDQWKREATSFLQKNPHAWSNVHARSQAQDPIGLYGVSLLPTFVAIDQIGNIQYQGGDISAAASKVAELVSLPSLPVQPPAGTPVASLN